MGKLDRTMNSAEKNGSNGCDVNESQMDRTYVRIGEHCKETVNMKKIYRLVRRDGEREENKRENLTGRQHTL